MPVDTFGQIRKDITSPLTNAYSITGHASNEVAVTTRAIQVNTDGTVELVFADATAAVTLALKAGITYAYRIKRVGTGGTVTTVIGLY